MTEKEINLNAGIKMVGGAPHTVVEASRETLSLVPEKTDKEVYAQPVEEEDEDAALKAEEEPESEGAA